MITVLVFGDIRCCSFSLNVVFFQPLSNMTENKYWQTSASKNWNFMKGFVSDAVSFVTSGLSFSSSPEPRWNSADDRSCSPRLRPAAGNDPDTQ